MLNVKIVRCFDKVPADFDVDAAQALWPRELERPGPVEGKPHDFYKYFGYNAEPVRLTQQEIEGLAALGVPLEIAPLPGAMLVKMRDSQSWEQRAPDVNDLLQGNAVHIAVPDFGLMNINEVKNLDDCCTDLLQSHLDGGWRLLAVCPPNARRRPDYIIGRNKPAQ